MVVCKPSFLDGYVALMDVRIEVQWLDGRKVSIVPVRSITNHGQFMPPHILTTQHLYSVASAHQTGMTVFNNKLLTYPRAYNSWVSKCDLQCNLMKTAMLLLSSHSTINSLAFSDELHCNHMRTILQNPLVLLFH